VAACSGILIGFFLFSRSRELIIVLLISGVVPFMILRLAYEVLKSKGRNDLLLPGDFAVGALFMFGITSFLGGGVASIGNFILTTIVLSLFVGMAVYAVATWCRARSNLGKP